MPPRALPCHEIAKFRGEDVTAQSIRVLGKGGLVAYVPTHPDLWALARQYPRQGCWFPSVFTRCDHVSGSHIGSHIRSLFRSTGTSEGSIHRARHTLGTNLVRQGANLRVVQELMRHSWLAITALHVGFDEDEMSAVVGRLGGAA